MHLVCAGPSRPFNARGCHRTNLARPASKAPRPEPPQAPSIAKRPMGSLDCNYCGEELRLRQQPPWRYSRRSIGLFALSAVAGVVVTPMVLHALDRALGLDEGLVELGMLLGAVAMLVLAYYAHRLPRVRTVRCSSCGVPERVSSRPQRDAPILESVRSDLGFLSDEEPVEDGPREMELRRSALKTRMRRNKRQRRRDQSDSRPGH